MVAVTGSEAAGPSRRFVAIDVAKGIAILAMVVYHFSWDLSDNRLIAVDVSVNPGWIVFARLIAGTFLALVGVNLVMAMRKGFRAGPYFRRLAIIAAAAVIVTLATLKFEPRAFIFFGVLHCIVAASVLALPLLRAPAWLTAVVAAFFLAGPHFLANPFFDSYWWYWLGLSTDPPITVDYVPIFPWFGVVLFGVIAGRFFLDHGDWGLWQWRGEGLVARFLAAAGRWSLAIYLIHQPILVGILFVVAPLIGPSEAALAEQVRSEYDASCAVAGYDQEDCDAYSRCIIAGLSAEPGILVAASRHDLSDAQVERWQTIDAECWARTLPSGSTNGA
ncbi:MAG: DUF1624 domain-containing protein [Bauldia sp.]|uniref:DUF1624 domain-containing protein n=1 Tax=Bauldia sp. TaxID=2575872 RepID=UPI001D549948|nr:heparan-alpha-glucosaminide N-acetyltransferase [Bauldia sp.]MCB1496423.1 DUF1624 domain-containing protein [Bauldia sp.]